MTMPVAGSEALPTPGELFEGKYKIEKLIGKGGMGAVFAAQHEMLNQRVAVKFLLGDIVTNPEAVQRFMNEARSAAQIQGEHVARVFDVGRSQNGLPFMVMEFLDGNDLAQIVETRGPLQVEDAVDYVLQALEAIAQAHKRGIVHRDLKPANLFLARRDDGSVTVKVLDFGISKASNPFSNTGNHALTSTKSVLGSPLYMSPEQLRSAKNVDPRADIWSLGVILFELLTGRVPFNGESLGELFVSILEQQIPRVSQIRPDVPQIVDDTILRCLQRPLDHRFNNVAELAHALASCAPPRAIASVERVMSTLGVAPGSMAAIPVAMRAPEPSFAAYAPQGAAPAAVVQTGPGASTQNNWGRTGSGVHRVDQPPKSNGPLFAGLAIGLVALIGGGIGVGYWATHRTTAAASTPSATAIATTPDPTTTGANTAATNTAGTTPTIATTAATTATTHAADSAKVTHTGSPTGKPPPQGTGAGTTKPVASAAPSATAPVTPPPPPPPPATTGTKFDPFAAGRK